MEGTGRLPKQRSRPYAQSALGLALSLLLPFAGCKHAPATQSRPITKDSHSQQPAAAPAAASASVQVLSPGPRFAVQVAAFNRREDAEALASQLSEQYGLQALVAPVEAHGATLYRVRLLVENKDQAEIVANTFLHTENKKVWIVALQ
jgi:cell division protein FtsN